MKRYPSDDGAAADPITKTTVELTGAVPEGSQSNLELLFALAASVDRNEQVQEKFRNAVLRRLARIEAQARVLQLCEIIDSRHWGPAQAPAKQEAAIEALISELSEELERNMVKEIYGGRDAGGARARRGRIPKWSDWEI